MPDAYLAPSLARLRAEINARWPSRDKSSDGWIGDPRHRATRSEHNPDSKGCVHALDVDVTGIDRALLVKAAIACPATWYVISNRVIYSRSYNFRARAYTGSNPHTSHVHISINLTSSSENWRGGWLPPTPQPQEDDDMDQTTFNTRFLAAIKVPAIRTELGLLPWLQRLGRSTDNMHGVMGKILLAAEASQQMLVAAKPLLEAAAAGEPLSADEVAAIAEQINRLNADEVVDELVERLSDAPPVDP
jgi:hypothetical protein